MSGGVTDWLLVLSWICSGTAGTNVILRQFEYDVVSVMQIGILTNAKQV